MNRLATADLTPSVITLDGMRQWSDGKILTFVREHRVDEMDLQDAWNETVHPEDLFKDFYDEVMRDKYTQADWEKLFEELGSMLDVEDGQTPRDALEEQEHLWEDAGELSREINPEYEPLLYIYMFKWLLNSKGWGDEFLLSFANGEFK